jgi:hypothetical protein
LSKARKFVEIEREQRGKLPELGGVPRNSAYMDFFSKTM